MTTLLDANQRPIVSNPQPGNGGAKKSTVDVRTVPTGTLFYNLVKFVLEETGLENAIHGWEMQKNAQGILKDPPQIDAMRELAQEYGQARYTVAGELNARFADLDQRRMAACGIEIVVPPEPTAPEPSTEPPPASGDATS